MEVAVSDLTEDHITTVSFFAYSFATTALIAEFKNISFSVSSDGKRLYPDRLSANYRNLMIVFSISNLTLSDSMTIRMFVHFKARTRGILILNDSVNIFVFENCKLFEKLFFFQIYFLVVMFIVNFIFIQ